ncbi:MAG: H-NS histone family protein [Pseudolabrys sp.]|jgi:DNA-binding protein H-NS
MNKISLEVMSTNDLWSLHEKITEILSARIISEKRELEKRLAALERSQTAIEGSVKTRGVEGKPRRKYPRVFPKFRNPTIPSETWSGRGKQPRWLVAAIKSGHNIHEFEIPEAKKSKGNSRRG